MTTVSVDKQAPAWDRFQAMSAEVHDMLIGAAQCRNHLQAVLEDWDATDEIERQAVVRDALHRLERVGI